MQSSRTLTRADRSREVGRLQGQLAVTGAEVRRTDDMIVDRARKSVRFAAVAQRLADRSRDLVKELAAVETAIRVGKPLRSCWQRFEGAREASVELGGEVIALAQGDLARSAGLDQGACDRADGLLAELSQSARVPWSQFTIPAGGEFYFDLSQVIRLRFPALDLWSLPVVAHEFGHYAGPRHPPIQKMLDEALTKDPTTRQPWALLHEHIADVFATYTLGPAYAATCILLRFGPFLAHVEQPGHPSPARRVHVILAALRQLGGPTRDRPVGSYSGEIQLLDEQWRAGLTAAGEPETLDPDITTALDGLAGQLMGHFDEFAPSARYSGWGRATTLKSDLRTGDPGTAARARHHTMADVLNAAWSCRLDDPKATSVVERQAVLACDQIMEERRHVTVPQRTNKRA